MGSRGRPSKYKPEYVRIARKATLLGATLEDLGEMFEVTCETLNAWMHKYQDFSDAIKNTRVNADAVVEQSLFQRAKGYSHPEDKVFLYNGEPIVVPTTKHYPPDTAAAFIWLKNRQPKVWRDKHEVEHAGTNGEKIQIEFVNAESTSD